MRLYQFLVPLLSVVLFHCYVKGSEGENSSHMEYSYESFGGVRGAIALPYPLALPWVQ